MLVITIEAARLHLSDFADEIDEQQLTDLVLAAQAIVEDEMGRSFIGADGWASVEAIPANVVHAVKIALGELYLKREGENLDLTTVGRLVARHTRISFS